MSEWTGVLLQVVCLWSLTVLYVKRCSCEGSFSDSAPQCPSPVDEISFFIAASRQSLCHSDCFATAGASLSSALRSFAPVSECWCVRLLLLLTEVFSVLNMKSSHSKKNLRHFMDRLNALRFYFSMLKRCTISLYYLHCTEVVMSVARYMTKTESTPCDLSELKYRE